MTNIEKKAGKSAEFFKKLIDVLKQTDKGKKAERVTNFIKNSTQKLKDLPTGKKIVGLGTAGTIGVGGGAGYLAYKDTKNGEELAKEGQLFNSNNWLNSNSWFKANDSILHQGSWPINNMKSDSNKSKGNVVKDSINVKDSVKTVNSKPAVQAPAPANTAAVKDSTPIYSSALMNLANGVPKADSANAVRGLPYTAKDSNLEFEAESKKADGRPYKLRQDQHTNNVYKDIAGVNMEALRQNFESPMTTDLLDEYKGLKTHYDKLKTNPNDRNNYQNFIWAKAMMDWENRSNSDNDKDLSFDQILQNNHKLYSSNKENLDNNNDDKDAVFAFDSPAATTGLKKKILTPSTPEVAGAAMNPVLGQFNVNYPLPKSKPSEFNIPKKEFGKPSLQLPKFSPTYREPELPGVPKFR